MRRIALPLFAVSLLASLVTLVTLTGLQQQCDNVPEDQQIRIVDNDSGDVLDVTGAAYGSASLQGVQGFSADILSCSSIYRHQWFVILFEVVACILGLISCASYPLYGALRYGLLGIFSILTVLCIQMTDSFLTASNVAFYREVPRAHQTMQTMISGCIATCTLNLLLVLALGARCRMCGGARRHACAAAQQDKCPIAV